MRTVIFRLLNLLVLFAAFAFSPASAKPPECFRDHGKEIVSGKLLLQKFTDPAGNPATAYIVLLEDPICLTSDEPDNRVDEAHSIHIFSSDAQEHAKLQGYIGEYIFVQGRLMAGHTVHHRSPIIMDVDEILL